MKKLLLTLLLFVSFASFAQETHEKGKTHRGMMGKMTPEQSQKLMLKKMILDLDLNANQQTEIGKILSEKFAKMQSHMKDRKDSIKKPSSDEIFEMKNKMLDEQIVMKAKMKKILNPEQFKKWEEIREQREEGMKNRIMKHHQKKGEK